MGNDKDKNLPERWPESLDDLKDLTESTFDRVAGLFGNWRMRDIEDTLGSSLPWLHSNFEHGGEENLWAFPVPSARQYDRCKDAGGESAWNKDGVWRCLFGGDDKKETFKDYTSYLDWRRGMRQAIAAEREKERQQWQSIWRPNESTGSNVRYISESEAEKLGKKVVSSSVTSETISKDDGQLETKKVVKKWYDDGSVSLSESTTNGKNGGWFWK
ncbi:hypothetical protein TRVA0_041S00914 [Trichomonascus vanleenenianus]|uniref:Mpm1p n=1 Tax=Trichomonascus vanleenenianus TaxID=2268995 RepID=UPI003EC98B4D